MKPTDAGLNLCKRHSRHRCIECAYIQELEAFKKEALELLRLALSFAPKGEVPEGLFPTSYHTLNYEDECKLQAKIDSAREFLFKHGDKNEI